VASWSYWQLSCCKLNEKGLGQQQQDVCASAAQLLKCFLDVTPGGECTGSVSSYMQAGAELRKKGDERM
jgi:hypothetical protein